MKLTNWESQMIRNYVIPNRIAPTLTGLLRKLFAADTPVAITATGTANLTNQIQSIDTSGGAVTLSVPDGASGETQFLTLIAADVTNAVTATFTTVLGMPASIQMTAQGQMMVLFWDGSQWIQVSEAGTAGGITVETLDASGALSVLHDVTFLDASGGALAMTLADGVAGQVKYCVLVDATNPAVITPVSTVGFTAVDLSVVGNVVAFMFDGTNWNIISKDLSIATVDTGGALDLDYDVNLIDANLGALALTLADGRPGQIIHLISVDAANDATITIANAAGMIAVPIMGHSGDRMTLIFDGTNWQPLSLQISADTTHTGAGAVPVTHPIVIGTTGGAEAWTLADGVEGQELIIQITTHAGVPTVTPATATWFATVAFAGVNDTARFRFTNGAWMILGATGGVTVT